MRRKKAFTLVELLAVILALVLVIGVFLIWKKRERDNALFSTCKANVLAICYALAIYTGANHDQNPWLISNNKWDAATGESQFTPPSPNTNYNVSALLFMLVRDGPSSSIFTCFATNDRYDPNTGAIWHGDSWEPSKWDFSPYLDGKAEHLSYSYQAPILDANGTWRSGVSSQSEAGLIILADKTPTYDGMNATFDWTKPGQSYPRTGMSQNHNGGERINLLYADLHIGDSYERADCGIANDNIYSSAVSKGDPPSPETEQGPGCLDLANHHSAKDSFLIGPKKLEK